MHDYKNKKVVFYSLINGVGSTTMAYQLARLLRLPLYQEQEHDLVFFLKRVIDSSKYTVKQLNEIEKEDYSMGAVYDLKSTNKRIFALATDIVVLTNNSYIDLLKTIAALQQIATALNGAKKQIHVIFNRLQNGNVSREKQYTNASKKLIRESIPNLEIHFSYIRSNLIFYSEISEGYFFMDHFFKRDKKLLAEYSEIQEMEYTDYLEMFFDYQYENEAYDFRLFDTFYQRLYDDQLESAKEYNRTLSSKTKAQDITPESINAQIAKLNFNQQNIRLSRASIKDMYSLLYKMDIYNKEMYNGKKCRSHIEEG